jgi:ATP-dependent DNA ligase
MTCPVVQKDGKRVRLFTRNGHDWSGRFTTWFATLKAVTSS